MKRIWNTILETKRRMGQKPLIVCMNLSNPTVVAEFEKSIEGLLVHFGVQDQALMEIISGEAEPSGLLPIQMPANMETVETQFEDVPLDMECHEDSESNKYDFAFGMNWSGVIDDDRVNKYQKR
jgi:beta-glucosidase